MSLTAKISLASGKLIICIALFGVNHCASNFPAGSFNSPSTKLAVKCCRNEDCGLYSEINRKIPARFGCEILRPNSKAKLCNP